MRNIKQRSDSVTGKVKAAQSHQKEYPTPDGRPKLSGIDKKRWKSYCLARDSWTDAELMVLYEAIGAHADIDAAREWAKGEPIMVEKPSGEMVANPIFAEIRARERSLQMWLKQIALQTSPERANSTNAGGKSADTEDMAKTPSNIRSLMG